MSDEIGQRFAQALATKDRAALIGLLNAQIDFRGLTPRKFWETTSAEELVDDIVLGTWFEPDDHIEELVAVDVGRVADRHRVAYRLNIKNGDGAFVVEQQAYFDVADGRINWLRILCSGYCPVEA